MGRRFGRGCDYGVARGGSGDGLLCVLGVSITSFTRRRHRPQGNGSRVPEGTEVCRLLPTAISELHSGQVPMPPRPSDKCNFLARSEAQQLGKLPPNLCLPHEHRLANSRPNQAVRHPLCAIQIVDVSHSLYLVRLVLSTLYFSTTSRSSRRRCECRCAGAFCGSIHLRRRISTVSCLRCTSSSALSLPVLSLCQAAEISPSVVSVLCYETYIRVMTGCARSSGRA